MQRERLLTLVVAVFLPGCAWRTASAEHYFGPVVFRYSDSTSAPCNVIDVWQLGVLAEAGGQWSLAVGVSDRLAAAPPKEGEAPRWTRPLSLWPTTKPGEWNLSLLYLRGEQVQPPTLVRRRLLGGGVMVGDELTALSVGYASRVNIHPREDSFSIVVFDAAKPLASRCDVLPASALEDGSLSKTLKEVE